MQVRGVDFVLFGVSDVERSRAFYQDTLGLTPAAEWPPNWYEFDAGGTTIAIAKPPEAAPQPPHRGGTTVALAVPDAKAAIAELRAKGVQVLWDVGESPVCYMALIADPDGNGIWIHQRKDGTAG
ncbi:MAG: VOC family protein [Chloroflexi bacterium]|nr:VOC family protein [Chloroflexota bacterium]